MPEPAPLRDRIAAILRQHELAESLKVACICGEGWLAVEFDHSAHVADVLLAELQLTREQKWNGFWKPANVTQPHERWCTPWVAVDGEQ